MNKFQKTVAGWFGIPVQDNIPTTIRTVIDQVKPKPPIAMIKKKFMANPPTTRANITASSIADREQQQDYDLTMIDAYIDHESFVSQTFSKIEEKAFNSGYQFVGKDKETIKYIRQRFSDMALVTGVPTDMLLREVFEDLIRYANCFLYKHRDELSSRGKNRIDNNGNVLEPIAQYAKLDATSVVPIRDDYGNVIKYRVGPAQRQMGLFRNVLLKDKKIWREVPKEDIVHIYFQRSSRNNIGTPFIWAALDDLRLLRKMEENVELLVQRHLFPLFHYMIGNDVNPALPEEIEKVTFDLELMPTEGGFVTPERHKIEVLGAKSGAIDAKPFLEYFTQRVVSGLGIGPISLGIGAGAAKGGATIIDRSLLEKAKMFQSIFATFFDEFIVKELLMEGGYDVYEIDSEFQVSIQFAEIDLDTQIKKETHAANMFNNQGINYDEFRIGIGKEVIEEGSEEWDKLQFNTFGLSTINEMETDSAVTIGRATGKVGGSKTGEAKSKAKNKPKAATNSASSANGPANQHGVKLSPQRASDSIIVADSITKAFKTSDIANQFASQLEDKYESARSEVIDRFNSTSNIDKLKSDIGMTLGLTLDNMRRASFSYIFQAYKHGFISGYPDIQDEEIIVLDAASEDALNQYNSFVDLTLNQLKNDVIIILNSEDDKSYASKVTSVFDIRKPYLYKNAITGMMKAHNYGKLRSLRNQNISEAKSVPSDTACDTCKSKSSSAISTTSADIQSVPPHHQGCECPIEGVVSGR